MNTEKNYQKTITAIIPSFNQGKFIKQAIDSVIYQEGDFFIDLIIPDGGSSDETVSIVENIKASVDKKEFPIKCRGVDITFWSKKDRGQSDAINQAIKISKGYIIGFIGSDDFYLPGAFEKALKPFHEDKDLDFIYAIVDKINEDNTARTKPPEPRKDETFESLLARGNSFGTQSTFFTKRIIDKVGGMDEEMHYCIDLDLWMRIFKNGKTKYLPETLSVFRIWEKSKTGAMEKKFEEERKIIAKRYGGNIIPSGKIYKIRGSFKFLNGLKEQYPNFYSYLKEKFYKIIDLFKYRPEK